MTNPIDMVLHCPQCGVQHIDEPEDSWQSATQPGFPRPWDNPPHKSHLCHGCGHIWRPADVPTNGVAAVMTRGTNDSPLSAALQDASELADSEGARAVMWQRRAVMRNDAEQAEWLADKIVAGGDYAKEAAAMLRRWPIHSQAVQEPPQGWQKLSPDEVSAMAADFIDYEWDGLRFQGSFAVAAEAVQEDFAKKNGITLAAAPKE